MQPPKVLDDLLGAIDGKGYKAYKRIEGAYAFGDYRLKIDHVQGDPYAAPSRVRVRLSRRQAGFPADTTAGRSRRIALCDFLVRAFHRGCRRFSRGQRGTGKSGLITIDRPGQQILERSAMVVDDERVEARFCMGLPARGRKIAGQVAHQMFFRELPRIVAQALYMQRLEAADLYRHITAAEDSDHLRARLDDEGLVGFVADGALLPRMSGIDDRPLPAESSVAFESPASLRRAIHLPNQGLVRGMGIPRGVSLIVGGGFHGKSTLLRALELGVYNHRPDDGRQLVVSLPETMKVRAADGRNIERVDISPFISNLPMQKDTHDFYTTNASGSTSQAANIIEALEAGARLLLLDEDTSATNFMIRDHRMQMLVAKAQEPITPLVDKVGQLHAQKGISTILVMGGSGDYFAAADHVIQMDTYRPVDVTSQAHAIADQTVTRRTPEGGAQFGEPAERVPAADGFQPQGFHGKVKITATRKGEILYGRTIIDIGDLEQIVDVSQTRAIGYAIHFATRYMDGQRTLAQVVSMVMAEIKRRGLEILPPYLMGDLALFRGLELAGAINRMRTATMRSIGAPATG